MNVTRSTATIRKGARSPGTIRFLRRAAPNLARSLREDYAREVLPAPFHPKPKLWPNLGLHATWVGHSTTLIRIDGFTVLTDPVFSLRAGLNFGPMTVGIKRLIEPAAQIAELPPVDLILLSHAHMDHFDLPSLRALESKRTTVITARRTGDLIRAGRYAAVHQLGWGEKAIVGSVSISAFEVAHWGARMRSDTYRGYSGYLIETDRFRIVFGGDTAMTDSFRQLRTASRRTDLAIMPIGAYDPWIHVHCNPEQALRMADLAGAEYVLPVHHQTFRLSRESRYEPIERLLTAAGSHTDRVCLRDIGQEFHL